MLWSLLQSPDSWWEEGPCCLFRLAVQAADVWDKCYGVYQRCKVSRQTAQRTATLHSVPGVIVVSAFFQVAPQWEHVRSGSEEVAAHLWLQWNRASLHPQIQWRPSNAVPPLPLFASHCGAFTEIIVLTILLALVKIYMDQLAENKYTIHNYVLISV